MKGWLTYKLVSHQALLFFSKLFLEPVPPSVSAHDFAFVNARTHEMW